MVLPTESTVCMDEKLNGSFCDKYCNVTAVNASNGHPRYQCHIHFFSRFDIIIIIMIMIIIIMIIIIIIMIIL